ncbi:hypothetical protein R5R35_011713 [Gryllus longicercus]|uniref:C-type lectin domain-containing protein n=1 Tax=Gryllus longicercus TaxID=2509291 RepID=A0AAN9VH66_9ORTH
MDARAFAWACVLVLGAAGAAGQVKTPKAPLTYVNNSQCEPCQACQPCAPCVQRPCPAPAPAPPLPPCRTPWALVAKYRSHPGIGVYRLHTQRATWSEAKKICEADGTHLAVINSQAEADLFKKFYQEARISDWFFLGFSRGKDGKFYTVQGRPLSSTGYARWGANEPNNAHGSEHCGFMLASGLLADGWCDARLTFICEAPL